MSHIFAKLSRCIQANGFHSPKETGLPDTVDVQEFDELSICWNSQKLNRSLYKTKKFYNSRGAVSDYGQHCIGKAYGYANKLLEGRWLTDEEYDMFWRSLLAVEHSYEGQESLWNAGGTRDVTGLWLRLHLDGRHELLNTISSQPYSQAVIVTRLATGLNFGKKEVL